MNFNILNPIPNSLTVWLACNKVNEWKVTSRSLDILLSQPTSDDLLSTAEVSKAGWESTDLVDAKCTPSHVPLRGQKPDTPSCCSAAGRKPLGTVSPKESCFVQRHPLSYDGLQPVTGPWQYKALAPIPQLGTTLRSFRTSLNVCWGHEDHITAQLLHLPNPASFFSFPQVLTPRVTPTKRPAHQSPSQSLLPQEPNLQQVGSRRHPRTPLTWVLHTSRQ